MKVGKTSGQSVKWSSRPSTEKPQDIGNSQIWHCNHIMISYNTPRRPSGQRECFFLQENRPSCWCGNASLEREPSAQPCTEHNRTGRSRWTRYMGKSCTTAATLTRLCCSYVRCHRHAQENAEKRPNPQPAAQPGSCRRRAAPAARRPRGSGSPCPR